MDVAYPLFLLAFTGGVILFFCARSLGPRESEWVGRVVAAAFIVRLAAATMFAVLPETRVFHEDADGYEWMGMRLAAGWSGTGPRFDLLPETQPNYGYKYLAASIYYVFGQFAPLPAYFNCLIGALSVFLVYRLTRMFFHPLVARRAALLSAFTPSMVLWSAVAIKDALMAFLILLALISCVALKRRFSIRAVLGVAFALAAVQPLRYYMLYFLGFAILLSLFLERGEGMVFGLSKQVLMVSMMAGLMVMVGMTKGASEGLDTLSLSRVSAFRYNMAVTAQSGFATEADVSTPAGAIAFLPIGLAELLLGPFPWQFTSLRALMAAPETIYWWLLFPSVLRGLWWAFRRRFAATSPLILFAVVMSCAYSLMHGNVGSGFRQRAQIFVILFVFAAAGTYRRRCQRAGIDPDLLLADHVPAPTPATAASVAA